MTPIITIFATSFAAWEYHAAAGGMSVNGSGLTVQGSGAPTINSSLLALNLTVAPPPVNSSISTIYAPLALHSQGTLWSYKKDCDVPCGVSTIR